MRTLLFSSMVGVGKKAGKEKLGVSEGWFQSPRGLQALLACPTLSIEAEDCPACPRLLPCASLKMMGLVVPLEDGREASAVSE